jgi:purine-binding chemotaxis protein CheW
MEEKKNMGEIERYLAFSLETEDYAIPLLSVKEVIAMPEITAIPYTPPHFLGIMNLRGQVISVIDMRLKFGLKPKPNTETAVVICDFNGISLGVVVDSVNQVLSLTKDQISPKPEVESNKKTDYILGVTRQDKKLILILDLSKTLNLEDHAALKQMKSA